MICYNISMAIASATVFYGVSSSEITYYITFYSSEIV